MFKKLFGSKPSGGSTSGSAQVANRTINSLEDLTRREEQLEKRKALLETKFDEEVVKAQKFLKANKKQQALMCLKKKKMIGDQVINVENLILRLNEQKIMLENQTTMADVVSTMKEASEAQKATMKHMNIDNVDQVLEAINEQTDEYKQVAEAMAQPAGIAGDYDEDDLLAELGELEQQELDKELLEPAPVPGSLQAPAQAMPSVPAATPAAPATTKTPEELELEALEAELAA